MLKIGLKNQVSALMKTLWELNQMGRIWMNQIARYNNLEWCLPLSDNEILMSQRYQGDAFFDRFHDLTQKLLDQLNEV